MPDPILQAVSLCRSFPLVVGSLVILRDLDLTIHPAEMVAVQGPSGIGKSTLLHLLGLLDRPTSGEVLLRGRPTAGLPDNELSGIRCREIGFVFQFHHLLPEFDALENVLIPARIAGTLDASVEKQARSLLDKFGLGERIHHMPKELSGGEQQRVAVARALLLKPSILLADEPSGNLDEVNAAQLHELLSELVRETGVALVVVTHNPSLAQLANRRLLMGEGKLKEMA